MKIKKEILDNAIILFGRTKNIENVVFYLKDNGLSKIESIIYLQKLKIIDLNKAKEAVHSSMAWSGRKEEDEKFHQILMDALDDENHTQSSLQNPSL